MNARRHAIETPEPDGSDMTPMIDIVFQLLIFFMLTMHFQEVEGKMLSTLPKDKGPLSQSSKVLEEVRLLVRGGRVFVEKHAIGELASTEKTPARGTSNKAVYRSAAEKLRGLIDLLKPSTATVILDAEGSTAYEHVIGLIDACKVQGIDAVEFVGDPRLKKYYSR